MGIFKDCGCGCDGGKAREKFFDFCDVCVDFLRDRQPPNFYSYASPSRAVGSRT